MEEREFEDQLRRALRPVAAPDGLAERIIRRAEAKRRPATQHVWLRWCALAAMLTVGTFGGLQWNESRRAKELEARRAVEQFTLAMNIATRKVSSLQKSLVVEVSLRPGESGQ